MTDVSRLTVKVELPDELKQKFIEMQGQLDEFNSTALATLEWAISLVEELTYAACSRSENGKTILDSMAVSVYAEAIDFLAGCGKVRITGDYGRRVIAEPVGNEDNAAPSH